MFTGIVQVVAAVTAVSEKGGERFVRIALPFGWRLRAGESVAINGVCSTVRQCQQKSFTVAYMSETLQKTTATGLQKGVRVNLERSLRLGDEVSGHLVTGHVDAVGVVAKVTAEGNVRRVTIRLPERFMCYIAQKGSVTVDGVSLTVAARGKQSFQVALISYTLAHTTLQYVQKGCTVNVEVDLIARYLDTLVQKS